MDVKNWLGPGFESVGESRMVQAVLESQCLERITVSHGVVEVHWAMELCSFARFLDVVLGEKKVGKVTA